MRGSGGGEGSRRTQGTESVDARKGRERDEYGRKAHPEVSSVRNSIINLTAVFVWTVSSTRIYQAML